MKCPVCNKDTGEDILNLFTHSFMEHRDIITDRITEITYRMDKDGP